MSQHQKALSSKSKLMQYYKMRGEFESVDMDDPRVRKRIASSVKEENSNRQKRNMFL